MVAVCLTALVLGPLITTVPLGRCFSCRRPRGRSLAGVTVLFVAGWCASDISEIEAYLILYPFQNC